MSDWKVKLKEAKEMVGMGLMTEAEFEDFRKNLLSSTGVNTKSSSPEMSKIGSYRISSMIGEGGMGSVYRAIHQNEMIANRQGGDVALKVMHAQYAQNPELRSRFEREATVCLKLEHPGIVRVYDLLEDQGQLGLVMEMVDGKPLSVIIGDEVGPIPWDKAKELLFQLLDAVDYAHQNGVVHRDIKPENVMVTTDQQIKILDFGIAKDLSDSKTKTGTGMGTVSYMAPEQYTDAKAVDHRADIYALGMTLYEMLAGRLPWEGSDTEFEILTKKNSGTLPLPTDFYPYIPEHVVAVIQQSIAKEIDARPSSCEEFKQLLKDSSVSYVPPRVEEEGSSVPPKKDSKSQGFDVDAETKLKENNNRGFLFLVVSIVLTIVMYSFPQGYYVAYPMILISTLAHEMGHGLMAVLMGGSFEKFEMYSDASGVAYWSGDVGRFARAMISAGGLIGPAIVGAGFFAFAKKAGRLFVFLGVFLIICDIVVVRNVFGVGFVGFCSLVSLWLGLRASKSTQQIAAYFIGIQLALSVFSRGDYLFTEYAQTAKGKMPSDVSHMSDALMLPYWVWGIICGLISVICLIVGIKKAVSDLMSK
jgi:serine/threonine protein kinase